MKKQDNLYQLIHSLSKAEKRNFKIIAAQHSKNDSSNYILLFDAIDRQKEYDETRLKKKFQNHPFTKNISKTKHLLYHLILKTLRQLNEDRSASLRLSILQKDAQQLADKSLYDQAYATLLKAARLAKELELHQDLFNILDRQFNWLPLTNSIGAIHTELQRLAAERAEVAILLNTEIQYKMLLGQASLLSYSPEVSKPFPQQSITTLTLDNPYLTDEKKATSFLSKICFNEIHALAAQASYSFPKAVRHLQTVRLLWTQQPEKINLFPDDYIRTTAAYMICCLNANRKDIDYDGLLDSLRCVPPVSKQLAARNHFFITLLDFICKLTNDQLDKCESSLFTIEEGLEEHIAQLSVYWKIELFYHIGIYHFLTSNYRKTLYWMDQIQQFDKADVYPQIQKFCKLIGLMALYELKDFDALGNDIRKVYRYLQKRTGSKEIERAILTCVKKLLNANHNRETKSIFSQLRLSLINMKVSNIPIQLVTSNVLHHWVHHKLSDDDIICN